MRHSLKQRQVKTGPPTTPAAAPRLPHEHDESADSQASGGPREDMQQAFEDLEKGLVDTDLHGAIQGTAELASPANTDSTAPNAGRTRDPNTQKLPNGNIKKKTDH